MKNFLIALIVLIPTLLSAEPPTLEQQAQIRLAMRTNYEAFRDLQPYMYDRDAFLDPKNEKLIGEKIRAMADQFAAVSDYKAKFSNEPGFRSTLKVLGEMLADAKHRFVEGKKGYALWRLKTSANYCVSCHTRFDVKFDFSDAPVKLSNLNTYEQAEFYLATRQFEKAKTSFLAVVYDPNLDHLKLDALRKWLIIDTRVYPDPLGAIKELDHVRARVQFSGYEEDEIRGWLGSLRRWANEGGATMDPLAKAENLIRQGKELNDPLSGRPGMGAVELLRATAMLHKLLDSGSGAGKDRRGRVLYLLGMAYNELPFFFLNELPEMFLEQCIRDYSGTSDAKNSFELLRDIMTSDYTGSGGTFLPDDVQSTLKELHDLAYGIPQPPNRAGIIEDSHSA